VRSQAQNRGKSQSTSSPARSLAYGRQQAGAQRDGLCRKKEEQVYGAHEERRVDLLGLVARLCVFGPCHTVNSLHIDLHIGQWDRVGSQENQESQQVLLGRAIVARVWVYPLQLPFASHEHTSHGTVRTGKK
jgi:hypothetical protein